MEFQPRHNRPTVRGHRRLFTAHIAFIAVALCGSVAAQTPLHVLLSNDDGYAAPGLVEMHKALRAAGYKVSVVAPRNQQSGSSMRVTLGPLAVEKIEDDFWVVSGTPADSVSFALHELLVEDKPDLVVSGINFGQNLGANTNLSGTVGAAMMATQLAIPAIAVSVGLDLSESGATPVRFPSTMAAFAPAADFMIKLIHQLEESWIRSGGLLPPNLLLNVNYPALANETIKGIVMTDVARVGGFVPRYLSTKVEGEYKATLEHGAPTDDSVADPDTARFARGYITVSILDGYLGVGGGAGDVTRRRLERIFTTPNN